ncbi:hypothetical protein QOT17_008236 [Balamuthia mandrillaris]
MAWAHVKARLHPANPLLREVVALLFASFLIPTLFLGLHGAMVLLYRDRKNVVVPAILLMLSPLVLLFYLFCFVAERKGGRRGTFANDKVAKKSLQDFRFMVSAVASILVVCALLGFFLWTMGTQLNHCKLEFWGWKEEATLEDIRKASPYQSVFLLQAHPAQHSSSPTAVPGMVSSASSPAASTIYSHVAAICQASQQTEEEDCLVHLTKGEDSCFGRIDALWNGRATLDGMVAVKTDVFQSSYVGTISTAIQDIRNVFNDHASTLMADSVTSVQLFSEEEFEEARRKSLWGFLGGIIPLSLWVLVVIPAVVLRLFVMKAPATEVLWEEVRKRAKKNQKDRDERLRNRLGMEMENENARQQKAE